MVTTLQLRAKSIPAKVSFKIGEKEYEIETELGDMYLDEDEYEVMRFGSIEGEMVPGSRNLVASVRVRIPVPDRDLTDVISALTIKDSEW